MVAVTSTVEALRINCNGCKHLVIHATFSDECIHPTCPGHLEGRSGESTLGHLIKQGAAIDVAFGTSKRL
jgi:hypothetical protein